MKKETILLVEDTKSTIELINTTLNEKGFAVSIATTGLQALEIAPKLQPALILLDILMPGIDGYETCRLLKENEETKNIPIIFLSALTKTFDKVKAFKLGGVDYLSKPVETDELLARIHTHLSISRLQNELKNANEALEEKVKHRTAELQETNVQLLSSINELFEKSVALQKSEERYKFLINTIMYPVVVSNFSGEFLFANEKSAEFVGLTLAQLYTEKSLNFWYDISQRNEFLKEITEVGFIRNKEVKLFSKEGVATVILSSSLIDFYGQEAILSIFNDITVQKKLEQQVLTATIETEERERAHFAQELHDGIGPLLSAAKMYVQWIEHSDKVDEIPDLLAKVIALIDDAHTASREISHNLSPHILKNFGFVVALKNYIEQPGISDLIKIKLNLLCSAESDCISNLNLQKQTIIYRVLCECINNTLKHAYASEIIISLSRNSNKLIIEYTDNGKGFEPSLFENKHKGLGIFNMKNRVELINGKFELNSVLGNGTCIKIEFEF